MKLEDRQNLALAYAAAWRVVKNERCDVEIKGGWFIRKLYSGFSGPFATSMRLSEIVRGLSALNTRILNGDIRGTINARD